MFGNWDPSLAIVMAVAVTITAAGYAFARRRGYPALAGKSPWPTKTEIDRPLILGALMFGTGWGLIGLCPGPSIVNLASLSPQVGTFVVAVAGGMIAVDRARSRQAQPS